MDSRFRLILIPGLVVALGGLSAYAQSSQSGSRQSGSLQTGSSQSGSRPTRSTSRIVSSRVVSPSTQRVVVTQTRVTQTPVAGSQIQQTSSIQRVSTAVPIASSSQLRATGGVANVLAELNAQRSRKGVRLLRPDANLQRVAERRAQWMASRGLKGHPPGSFAPGRYEGVGWSSTFSPSRISACYTSDSRMQYAGAAMATGRDGVYFAVVYR